MVESGRGSGVEGSDGRHILLGGRGGECAYKGPTSLIRFCVYSCLPTGSQLSGVSIHYHPPSAACFSAFSFTRGQETFDPCRVTMRDRTPKATQATRIVPAAPAPGKLRTRGRHFRQCFVVFIPGCNLCHMKAYTSGHGIEGGR